MSISERDSYVRSTLRGGLAAGAVMIGLYYLTNACIKWYQGLEMENIRMKVEVEKPYDFSKDLREGQSPTLERITID